MRIAKRRFSRPFDVRRGLGFLGDDAAVSPTGFAESAAPIGTVSVTPTGFGEAAAPAISDASLVSSIIPNVSASDDSAALFAPDSLQASALTVAAPQSAAAAALKIPTPEEVAAAMNLSAADAAQLIALQAAQAAVISSARAALVAQWNNSVSKDRYGNMPPLPAAYANFDPLHAGSSITGPNPYTLINLSNSRYITPGNIAQNDAAKAAISARDNYFATLNSVAPAIRAEVAGAGVTYLYAGPASSAGQSLHNQLTQQFNENAGKVPGLVSPDYYAREVFNEHYGALNQGYTEGSNLTAIQYTIADRFYNQPALVAARGGTELNILGSPAVQDAIARGSALATDRWRATQDGDFEEIVGSVPGEYSAFYHEMPMLAQVAFNYAASGVPGYVATGIDVLSQNSYQYHTDINSTNVAAKVLPTQINSGTVVTAAINIASQSDSSGEGGGEGGGDGGGDIMDTEGADFDSSSADSSFSSNDISDTPSIDFQPPIDFAGTEADFSNVEIPQQGQTPSAEPLSSPESSALFPEQGFGDQPAAPFVGDLETAPPPMPAAVPESNPYGATMPAPYLMPAAIPETADSLRQMGLRETSPGVWSQAPSSGPGFDLGPLENILYKTADGLLMKYLLSLTSSGTSIFAPTQVAGSAPAGSRIVNLPPGTSLAPASSKATGPTVIVRGGAGILKDAGLQIGKIADTLSANPLLFGAALLGAAYLGRRVRSSRRAA